MGKSMREGIHKSSKFIEIHFTTYLVALGYILTGHYLNLMIFFSLLLIHELGHCLAAFLCHVFVKKIIFYPYGGKTVLEDYLNRNIHQEFFIASAGVIIQFAYYLLICLLHQKYFIRTYTMELFTLYNREIIFFNLLPIYPLDGGKIISLLFQHFMPYQKANYLSIITSFLTIILFFLLPLYHHNYSTVIIFSILLYYLMKFYQNRRYLYQKFLLERYLYPEKNLRLKKIAKITRMYRNKIHLIKKNKTYYPEKEYLSWYFKPK